MKKALIIAAILCVAGIVIVAGALAASGMDFSSLDITKYETETYTVSEDFTGIEISSKETDIAFAPSTDGKCSVVCVERHNVKHTVTAENGTLKISVHDDRKWYDHIGFFTKPLKMTVYLPSEEYRSLSIDCRTGDVTIPAEFRFGDISVTASTGDVKCSASAGAIEIRVSTGDITLDELRAAKIALRATTGDIAVRSTDCGGALSAEMTTGSIKLTDVTCRDLNAVGSTGDIRMQNVIASGGFDIKVGTGDVRFEKCDAAQITVETSTGDVTGTLLSEKIFVTKTSTGDIDVPATTSGGKCEITTSTGDIRIEIAAE